MKLPASSIIAREKVTEYLLVRKSRNDKSAFLEKGGYSPGNPDALIVGLKELQELGDAILVDDNQFGVYYEVVGIPAHPKVGIAKTNQNIAVRRDIIATLRETVDGASGRS
jgi:hypothetical protein